MYEKFPRIPFKEAISKYGTDKPDLRNPLLIHDISEVFKRDDVNFEIFKKLFKSGCLIKSIVTKKLILNPEVFFDNIDKWAKDSRMEWISIFFY